MALIKDFNKYKIGIELSDKHHKNLIDIVNELFDTLTKGADSETILFFIKRLNTYANAHFKAEEDLMLDYKYPDLLSHKVIHKKFIDKLELIAQRAKNESVGKELVTFLVTWLIDHILKEDKKYADFILKKEN